MDYRVRTDNGFLTAGYTRSKFPAWSLDGGQEGSPNYVEYIPKDGEPQRYSFVSGLTTHTGDIIRVVTGNGGGIGDPKERDDKLVRRDIKNGLITPERGARRLRGRHLNHRAQSSNPPRTVGGRHRNGDQTS